MDRTDAHTPQTHPATPARAPRSRRALAAIVEHLATITALVSFTAVALAINSAIGNAPGFLAAVGTWSVLAFIADRIVVLELPHIGRSINDLTADRAAALRSPYPSRVRAAVRELLAAERDFAASPPTAPDTYTAESEMFLEANRRVAQALANPYLPDHYMDPRDTLIYGDCSDEQQIEDLAVGDRVQVVNPRWAWQKTDGLTGRIESISGGLIAVSGIDNWFRERFIGRRGYTAAELYRLEDQELQTVPPEL